MPTSLNQRSTAPSPEAVDRALERVRRLAWWTDNAIRIPVLGWRFGLQPIIGLFPVVGDLVGLALTTYSLQQAWTLGAPRRLLWRMAGNAVVDFFIGLVPGIGDLADAVFKANARNLRLLEQYLASQQPRIRRSPWRGRLLALLLWLGVAALAILLVQVLRAAV